MNRKKGFTLVEIMIVVLIIGILVAIAVPNFVRARETSRRNTCISNLKQIDSAKEQYAMEARLNAGAPVTEANLVPDYIKADATGPDGLPNCPSTPAGTQAYTINAVGTNPVCSVSGHVLP